MVSWNAFIWFRIKIIRKFRVSFEEATTVFLDSFSVIIAPDIRAYFPDSESVNRALRCLIPLLPQKRKVKVKKA